MITETSLQTRLQVAKQASFISGDELRRQFETDWGNLSLDQIIEQANAASLSAIRIFLSQIFPTETIWGKGMKEAPDGTSFWIFDSLNGGANFASRSDNFATTVAWVQNGQPTVGVVSVPSQRALYSATKGGGAFFQDELLHARTTKRLEDAILLLGLGEAKAERATTLKVAAALSGDLSQLRGSEAPALEICRVAAGIADAYLSYQLRPWDWVAARLILEEAGGSLSDLEGKPMKLKVAQGLASNGLLHTELLRRIEAAGR